MNTVRKDYSQLSYRPISPERLDGYMAKARMVLGAHIRPENLTVSLVREELSRSSRIHTACVHFEETLEEAYGQEIILKEVDQMKKLHAGKISALCDLEKIAAVLQQIEIAF